jgi:predicted unusual protein kinase regulating ubiquinone biosynthesis (AarF/ABC1/UbiB family)
MTLAHACCCCCCCADPHPGNLLASRDGSLVYLDFGMMSEAPQYARYAIMAHVVHLVNR